MSLVRRLLFPLIILNLVGWTHYYLISRLALAPELGWTFASVVGSAIGILGVISLIKLFVGPRLPPWIAWPGGIWMGIFFLLLWMLGLSELVVVLLPDTVEIQRLRAFLVTAIALTTAVTTTVRTLRGPKLKRVSIALSRWAEELNGYRIVQISDVHIGQLLRANFSRILTERINALSPDLVAVTGDLVDGPPSQLNEQVSPLGSIQAKDGVFFVTGNHDHYSGADGWVDFLTGLGWKVLRNRYQHVGEFDLAGVEDRSFGTKDDVSAAVAGRDSERPLILLAHDPHSFREAQEQGVDLQLSGHTHGGQIWPWRFLVRILYPWVAGIYQAQQSVLYVSRGTGFWGPPMRLFSPAEITEITLTSKDITREKRNDES